RSRGQGAEAGRAFFWRVSPETHCDPAQPAGREPQPADTPPAQPPTPASTGPC
ncbi:unnamed protein product, partial [Rangifer tarandus platyrhynchus]